VDVVVYWDTIYNSYMFAFAVAPPGVTGVITDKLGKPVPHTAVTLSAGPKTFRTFTDAKGEYRFYDTPPGPVKVTALGQDFPVTTGVRSTEASAQ
jgi:hypothetical protein